ncbi:MAG: 6-phospho-beta-glucosidase [Clostridiales bacterium]|jgi:6-phospho-beta-glucosidase|nr:6-phospho-beta-glucosidase [Clostridiales bacterium]
MKIAIIGAGSSYTPELLEKLGEMREELPVADISLMDADERRLAIVGGFCERYAARLDLPVRFDKTRELPQALHGADFVVSQIRVGGNEARINDEKIPLSFGLVGQETTGAGGFMKALRTVPAMLEIARAVEKHCPDAWIVNYANPTGIVAEAVGKHSRAKIAGLCAGGFCARGWTSLALNVDRDSVRYDIAGLNHMNFSYGINVRGKELTPEQFRAVAAYRGEQDTELCVELGALPSPYLQYYFHTAERVRELRQKKLCRAEQVLLAEKEAYRDFADPACDTKPAALAKRGGGGYSDIALGFVSAVCNDRDSWIVANVPNRGTIGWLPDDAVIETACVANAAGLRPLSIAPVPMAVRGLISAVKNYEQLAVEAAVAGSAGLAELALLAHPLVADWDIVKQMLPKLIDANRQWLQNFHVH